MKQLLVLLLLLSCSYLHAATATVQILEVCNDNIIHSFTQEFEGQTTVSAVTLRSFKENNIPYQGAEQGINSILETATGMDALEILSDTQMRAYGWCFRINGHLSDEMMHQTFFQESATITWYYGFSSYDSGEWSGFCTPARIVSTCHKF
ncbi:MAG: hypothetical protein KAG61_07660 [Bacteriovoracaceae bacterium]|nr:hypothetical protein [Bacteriovoracaceae bacterium]